jgi:osmotically-inducible protein OsmY
MSIIIISSDIREIEEMIAEKVAEEKKYNRLDRRILKDLANKEQIDSGKLIEALEKTPSLIKKFLSRQWQSYLACIEAEVLERMLENNLVCWGLAAHLYIIEIPHVMKVRILSGKSSRITKSVEQTGDGLQKGEKYRAAKLTQRKKWSQTAFNQDETDLSRYDLVISLDQIDPVEAVQTITSASEYRKFQVMTYSMKCLTDLALTAKVNATLLKSITDVKVQVRNGSVVVSTQASNRQKRKKIETIKDLVSRVKGVEYVEVHVKKTF